MHVKSPVNYIESIIVPSQSCLLMVHRSHHDNGTKRGGKSPFIVMSPINCNIDYQQARVLDLPL